MLWQVYLMFPNLLVTIIISTEDIKACCLLKQKQNKHPYGLEPYDLITSRISVV